MSDTIDESLYSRQLYVLGKDAMTKMAHSDVLIIGLNGLGVEIVKNVALAGVKSISLWDPKLTTINDLSSQYYLSEEDIGKPRASSCVSKLGELNQYVPVSVEPETASLEQIVSKFKAVLVADVDSLPKSGGNDLEAIASLNNLVRQSGGHFIWAQSYGLTGAIFNDFGDKFTVFDTNGEQPVTGVVADINNFEVLAPGSARHLLEDNMIIELVKAEPASFNGQYRVKVPGPMSFVLNERIDGQPMPTGKYVRGGEWKQIKEPCVFSFKSFGDSFAEPEFFMTDFAKFENPAQTHLAIIALSAFKQQHQGELPRPWNENDANELADMAQNALKQFPKIAERVNSDFIKLFAKQSRGQVCPINTAIGGTAAQELLKAVSGKFTPIKQYFYYDAFETIPDGGLTEASAAPKNSRYDPYYAVWGHELMDKIHNLRVFLVGAGAIGCEVLKCWAMLGLGSGPNGHIIVTDNDNIERSNLNRQFLFRPKDVNSPKSSTAVAAVRAMNSDYKSSDFTTYTDKVGADTEDKFDSTFWTSLDLVTNALDNVEARTYVDRRCVEFEKPLVESGTLGTKGNVQIVVPFLTESYSSSSDPPEASVPLCTLHSFPTKIEHTIAWANMQFQTLFSDIPSSVNAYLTQPNFVESTLKQSSSRLSTLKQIYSYLVENRPISFDQCIVWAAKEFEKLFDHDIRQLLYQFPKDAQTQDGTLFWLPPKRCPSPISIKDQNEFILDFVIAAANLRAFNFGLTGVKDREVFKRYLANIHPSEWHPETNVHIKASDDEPDADTTEVEEDDVVKQIAEKLPAPSTLAGFRLYPAVFEKDDDSNFHIDFINAASNLRASNYGIEPVERSQTKFIAGKIIPAIATTTAVVTGFSTLEAVKVIQNKKLEEFKNGFINLALPFFGFSEPIPSTKFSAKCFENIDSIWGKLVIGNIKIAEFVKNYETEYKVEINMITCGNAMIYASFFPPAKRDERLKMHISEAYESVNKQALPSGKKILQMEVSAEDEEGEDVDGPPIYVRLE